MVPADIKATLPSIIGTPEPTPPDLIGARIIHFGSFANKPPGVEGGLVIDYSTVSGDEKRIVINFTEEGMWVYSDDFIHSIRGKYSRLSTEKYIAEKRISTEREE